MQRSGRQSGVESHKESTNNKVAFSFAGRDCPTLLWYMLDVPAIDAFDAEK
jgi:hypothetical protein